MILPKLFYDQQYLPMDQEVMHQIWLKIEQWITQYLLIQWAYDLVVLNIHYIN